MITSALNTAAALSLILALSSPQAMAVGGMVGNGGDIVLCRSLQDDDVSDVYALDFVTSGGLSGAEFITVADWSDAIQQLQTRLAAWPKVAGAFASFARSVPPLAMSLADVEADSIASSETQGFYSVPAITNEGRVWQGLFPLPELDDEADLSRLPRRCLWTMQRGSMPNVSQVMIRSTGDDGQTVYDYDPLHLTHMKENSPLQLSFTYIHEWLRDYINDAEAIREVNELLHLSRPSQSQERKLQAWLRRFDAAH